MKKSICILINPSTRPLEFTIGHEFIGKYQEFVLVDANLDFLDYLALQLENMDKSVMIIDRLDELYRYVCHSRAGRQETIEFRFFLIKEYRKTK